MLYALSIRDFVIVDSLNLEFDKGFSAMTGETGAGKSILIDALELAMGARSDTGVVREGAAKAEISAEFAVTEAARNWLKANDIDEDDVVILRRVIDASGRSRGFINGSSATAGQLKALGECLVDIHGQHAHQSLLRTEGQRLLLDRHAGLQNELAETAKYYRQWQALLSKSRKAAEEAEQNLKAREDLQWQLEDLEKINPKADEWEEISNTHSRLSNAASLMEGANEALSEISESEMPILSRISSIHQKLSRLAELDDALEPMVELLDSASIQLQEVAHSLSSYLSHADLDPDRLAEVEDRLNTLYSAGRRYRVKPEELPEKLTELKKQMAELTEAEDTAALAQKAAAAEAAYRKVAGVLSKKRADAAEEMGKAVTAMMASLSMAGGRFAVALNPVEPGLHGREQVEFMVAGHEGAPLRPLAKVASGGELARIALAISVIATSATEVPTLIFDEVDSGIGGGVAEVVGRLLKKLGGNHQVLCVTHLPQVASQAENHFQVSKTVAGGIPLSHIVKLNDKARVEEIARMLGGVEITETTRKHAKEMLAG